MKLTTAVFYLCATSVAAFSPLAGVSRAGTGLGTSTSLNVNMLARETGRAQLDPAVVAKYDALSFPDDTVLAEYVWVDADGNTRSKTRTIPAKKVRRQ